MSKEVLAVDYDDCLVPFQDAFKTWLLGAHGHDLYNHTPVPGKFHYDEAYPDCGIDASSFSSYIEQYTEEASIDTAPYGGVEEALTELAEYYELHVVTARAQKYRNVTERAIEKYFGGDLFQGVHTAEFNGSHKKISKVSMYRYIGATATVDDADHNINAAIEVGMRGFSIQYPDHSHNGHSLHPEAVVVASFDDIVRYTKTERVA